MFLALEMRTHCWRHGMPHSGQTPVIWIREENDRDDPDSRVMSRRLRLAVVGSSTAVMAPWRPIPDVQGPVGVSQKQ